MTVESWVAVGTEKEAVMAEVGLLLMVVAAAVAVTDAVVAEGGRSSSFCREFVELDEALAARSMDSEVNEDKARRSWRGPPDGGEVRVDKR